MPMETRYALRQTFVDGQVRLTEMPDCQGAMDFAEGPMPRGCYIQEAFEYQLGCWNERFLLVRRERPRSSRIAKC